jgi:hypothetical protein
MGTNTVPIMGVVVPITTIVSFPPTPKRRRVVRLPPGTNSKTLHQMLDGKPKKRKKTK